MRSSPLLLVVGVFLSACGGGESTETPPVTTATTSTLACVPGKQEACTCPGGGTSAQVCRADGSGYEACTCGTGGAGGATSSTSTSGTGGAGGATSSTSASGTGGAGGATSASSTGGAGGSSTSSSSGGSTDYCNEYYPPGHPARSAPGFSVPTTLLEPVTVDFSMVFANGAGSGDPVTLQQILDNTTQGRGAFAGPHAGPGKYMSIPIDIPANTPAKTGFWISMVEPQGFQGMSPSTKLELTISPCQGDFRAVHPFSNDSSDIYDRAQCRVRTSGGLFASTGNLDGPNGYCFLKPGTRMYINITNHSLDDYRATGAAPVWGCKEEVTNCGKKADIRHTGDD